MYAVFEDGSRQYRVTEGDVVKVDYRAAEAGAKTSSSENPLAPRQPHFPAKAKRVIYIFQAGAPSHLELFDNKPELAKHDGQLPPAEELQAAARPPAVVHAGADQIGEWLIVSG